MQKEIIAALPNQKWLVPRFVNSLPYHVVPAQAGIQPQSNIDAQSEMDPRLRGDDNKEANLQDAPLVILTDSEYRKKIVTRKVLVNNSPILTQRELQCLNLIAQGKNTKEIAVKLFLSNETIDTHTKSKRQKLDCKNIAGAVVKAFRWRLL